MPISALFLLVLVVSVTGCSDAKRERGISPLSAANSDNSQGSPERSSSLPDKPKDNTLGDDREKEEGKPDPEPGQEMGQDQNADSAESSCYKGDPFICEIERLISQETNKLRIASSKSALVHAQDHSFISRSWSEAMAQANRISHDGFPAQRKSDFQKEFGASTNYYAENVAMLSDGGDDAAKIAEKFITMWWNSAGHKANMLGKHKRLGSGVAKKGNAYYATQLFN